MPLVLTAQSVIETDRKTIHDLGVPSLVLMERAARECFQVLYQHFNLNKRIALFCGTGNNGGDGLALARILALKNHPVTVFLCAHEKQLSPDNYHQFNLLQHCLPYCPHLKLIFLSEEKSIEFFDTFEVIVDALFGVGFHSFLTPFYENLIQQINQQKIPLVSIDIPSGLNATTGVVSSVAIKAQITLSIGLQKVGHLIQDGPDYCGTTYILDIGIPPWFIKSSYIQTDVDLVQSWLPRHPRLTHKYKVGYLASWVGSMTYPGAAMLSLKAAFDFGVGGIKAFLPESIGLSIISCEPRTTPLFYQNIKGLSTPFLQLQNHCRAGLVGCGLIDNEQTDLELKEILENWYKPIVLDAEALNSLNRSKIKKMRSNWLLTPHEGEFIRLLDEKETLTPNNRLDLLKQKAQKWECTILLKGFPSLIADPAGTIYVNSTGDKRAAVAGSGDQLAGACASFLAQGLNPTQASVCAVYLAGQTLIKQTHYRVFD